MAQQLRLLDSTPARFRLDERTKSTGRRGIAKAREALRESAERVAFADPALGVPVADLPRPAPRPAPRATPSGEPGDRPADAA